MPMGFGGGGFGGGGFAGGLGGYGQGPHGGSPSGSSNPYSLSAYLSGSQGDSTNYSAQNPAQFPGGIPSGPQTTNMPIDDLLTQLEKLKKRYPYTPNWGLMGGHFFW